MKKKGLLQASGIVLYIVAVAGLMANGSQVFGRINSFVGPLLFLTLFVVSAMVCGLMMFYQPYQLFAKNKKKDALNLVIVTTKYLGVFLLLILVGMMLRGLSY